MGYPNMELANAVNDTANEIVDGLREAGLVLVPENQAFDAQERCYLQIMDPHETALRILGVDLDELENERRHLIESLQGA